MVSIDQRELPAPDLHQGIVWEIASWAYQELLKQQNNEGDWAGVKEQSLVMFIW